MTDFYQSPEWRAVRKIPLAKYPHRCMRCGSRGDIQVDHIKPRSLFPELALSPGNLQLLCSRHNREKALKIIDYRPCAPIWDYLAYTQNAILVIFAYAELFT